MPSGSFSGSACAPLHRTARFPRRDDRHRTALLTRAVPRTRPILVLDSTVLTADGRQGQAAIGFTRKKRGRPAHLPPLSFDGTPRDGWAASFHPGTTHVSAIRLPLLAEAWAKLPQAAA